MQVPCMQHFKGRKVCFDRLKSILPKLLKNIAKILKKLSFLLIYSFAFDLTDESTA